MYNGNENIVICDHPLVKHKITMLRNKNTGTNEFRAIVEEIANERPDIKVGKVNVDEQSELAAQFGIMSIPTLIVIKDGKITNQSMGAKPKEAILALL